MLIKKHLMSILRWGLRLHGVSHLIEVFSAIAEQAYITAGLAFLTGSIEILSSFLLPNEHIHFKGIKTEVHSECDDK